MMIMIMIRIVSMYRDHSKRWEGGMSRIGGIEDCHGSCAIDRSSSA